MEKSEMPGHCTGGAASSTTLASISADPAATSAATAASLTSTHVSSTGTLVDAPSITSKADDVPEHESPAVSDAVNVSVYPAPARIPPITNSTDVVASTTTVPAYMAGPSTTYCTTGMIVPGGMVSPTPIVPDPTQRTASATLVTAPAATSKGADVPEHGSPAESVAARVRT